ncbi:MAG: type II toxin-antitoxin system Phd/YefM family antitoxin [Acidobacteriota bacterium]
MATIIGMKVVGVRELKDRLSEYLRLVSAGNRFLVTDHGEVVAELREPGSPALVEGIPAGLADLAARGKIRLGARQDASVYRKFKRATPEGSAQKFFDEDRSER